MRKMQRKQLHTALGDVVADALFEYTNIDDIAEDLLTYLEANNLLKDIENE